MPGIPAGRRVQSAAGYGRRLVQIGSKRAALGAAEAAGGAGFAMATHQRGEGFRYPKTEDRKRQR